MNAGVYEFDCTGKPEKLSNLLREAKAGLAMPCSGRGVCGKCIVLAVGELSETDETEREHLSKTQLNQGLRLACRAFAIGKVRVTLKQNDYSVPFEEVEASSIQPSRIGVAVDVGTTTVTAALVNLSDGTVLASTTALNPQAQFGADVISRLQESLNGNTELLKSSVCDCVNKLINSLCQNAVPEKVIITGNTAMLYLLTGREPSSITSAPFEADCLFGEYINPYSLMPDAGEVYLPPCISAFVGADTVCAMLGADNKTGFLHSDKPCVLADIGTNGEIVLTHNGKHLCCSAAAGPAFEGASLTNGSLAVNGAVSAVKFNGFSVTSEVIGGGLGRTICGSGIVSAVAAMLEAGILDEAGNILSDGHRFSAFVTEYNEEPAFILPDTDVRITQTDIRSIQLAKSAICAGIVTLIKCAGLDEGDIAQLVVAGGFGKALDMVAAEKIGLIPAGFADKTVSAGNSALEGAVHILLNGADCTAKLVSNCKTEELSASEIFFNEYIERMGFDC